MFVLNINIIFAAKYEGTKKTKIHIKRHGNFITVVDDSGRVLYSSILHPVAKWDHHPYISGFSKIADLGEDYSEMLSKVRSETTSDRIRSYWENVGHYMLDIATR